MSDIKYMQGYEDGIKATCELLRGLADAAELQSKNDCKDAALAHISHAVIRSTRETVLENIPAMLKIRHTQGTNTGKVH